MPLQGRAGAHAKTGLAQRKVNKLKRHLHASSWLPLHGREQ